MVSRKTQKNSIEKRICISLAFLCVMLFILYIYFISASVAHVVVRTETTQAAKKINSEIALLEGRYIKAQNHVSADIASLQGYTQTSHKVFIKRSSQNFALSNTGIR